MRNGDYQRALDLCLRVLVADPNDHRAQREAGRALHALGNLPDAADHLARAAELAQSTPDPELHYLLGEAYYALGRASDAAREHELARAQIAPTTQDWMELLWLARIHARRGELRDADAIYLGLRARKPRSLEPAIAQIEAHALARDWTGAEILLRGFIAVHPDHARAHEMLAWVLEAQNKLEEERELRAQLVNDPDREGPQRLIDDARVLERTGSYSEAIGRYQQALRGKDRDAVDDPVAEMELRAAVERLSYRLSPEVAALGGVASDPSGSVSTAGAGVAVPVADYATLAIRASMDQAAGVMASGGEAPQVRIGTVDASIVAGEGRVVSAAVTASGSYTDHGGGAESDARMGGAFDLRVGQGRKLQLQTSGDLDMPWREAASTIREGGRETGITAHLYALPLGPNLIFDAGTRFRSMELAPQMDVEATGSQKMVFGGADWVAWSRPAEVARGQILDENLRWAAYLADSLTIGYRRFEAFTRDDFGGRLVLADRDSIDQLSAIARKTLAEGRLGAEARTGAGIDWARDIRLWSAGFSLLITPIERARASITYDYAKESTAGFVGVRHTAWASIHVDL